jgi:hypothetical protein
MQKLMNTILDIYSAPGSTTMWDEALGSINDLTGGKGTAYVLINNDDGYAEFSNSYGYPKDLMNKYSGPEGTAADDARVKYVHNLLPGQVFREFEYVEDKRVWDESEFNKFELKEMGIYYCISALISKHRVWSDYISVNRLKSRGPHTDREKADLQLLLPHLAKAGEIHLLARIIHKP